MVRSGMLIFKVSFFFFGMNAITSFYFTAVGNAFASALISMSRGLVVLLDCIFVLPAYFGMTLFRPPVPYNPKGKKLA